MSLSNAVVDGTLAQSVEGYELGTWISGLRQVGEAPRSNTFVGPDLGNATGVETATGRISGGSSGSYAKPSSPTESAAEPGFARGRSLLPKSYRVAGLQQWTGVVVEASDAVFVTELTDRSSGETFMGEFDLDLLGSDKDIRVGDVVYVTARRVEDRGGPTRTTSIRRRRLGRWSEEDVRELNAAAEKELSSFMDLFED